jgi:hypothetical protein
MSDKKYNSLAELRAEPATYLTLQQLVIIIEIQKATVYRNMAMVDKYSERIKQTGVPKLEA